MIPKCHTRPSASSILRFACEIAGYCFTFLGAMLCPKAVLAAKLLAAESQLAICKQRIEDKKAPRPRFSASFRVLWVVLSKVLAGWERWAHLMQPATVKRWHTRAFQLYWRRESRSRPGRPPIAGEMQQLIARLSTENRLWGAGQIRDTLLLLGHEPPCLDRIRKYMVKGRPPRAKSTTWLAFLRNHLEVSWAIDFFSVTTRNFATLYVFLVFGHGRRRVVHWATTYHPSMDWVIQQLREATPYGQQPRYVFRDNDGIYGHGVRAFLDHSGMEEVRIAYQSPWQSPFIERFVGTLRQELLACV